MLPADRLSFRVVGGEIVPDWLGPEDHPWLRDLLDRVTACLGCSARELDERLRRPMPRAVPPRRLRMAIHVVRQRVDTRMEECRPGPGEVREVLFLSSSAARQAPVWSRNEVIQTAAAGLSIDVPTLERCLFLDLPSERTVRLAEPLPSPSELALLTNLALAQTLLQRSATLQIRAFGNTRDLVRHLRLRGLLCVVRRADDGLCLEVSGPFSLFRRTTLYGRALASVVPRLPWCEHFAVEARCLVRGAEAVLRLGPTDPIFPSTPPRQFDSRIEEKFARDLAQRFPDWELVREPEPVEVGGRLIFPDFALYRSAEPGRWWFVEIVGFWTPEYLRTKLEHLRQVASGGWIVCIDEKLNCTTSDLPPSVPVLRFRRRIEPAQVIALAAEDPGWVRSGRSEVASLGLAAYFLDWAGRRGVSDPVHARLSALRPGEVMRLVARDGFCFVVDARDQPVAALSGPAKTIWEPRLGRVIEVRVRDLVRRVRTQSGERYRSLLRVDSWQVPLVDIRWHGEDAASAEPPARPEPVST